MTRVFVETTAFQSRWNALGMTEDDLQELQNSTWSIPTLLWRSEDNLRGYGRTRSDLSDNRLWQGREGELEF